MSSVVSSTSAHHGAPHQPAWEWWLAALIALAAAGSGAYGLWLYDVSHEGEADLWSIGYHTLQLFVLHAPHLDPPIPWPLHLGRWLAALVVSAAVMKGLLRAYRS